MSSLFHFENLFPFAIPPLLTMLSALFLASVTIQAGRSKRENQLFTIFCLLQGLHYLSVTFETLWTSKVVALYFTRSVFVIYVFIVPVSVHFIHRILKISRRKWLIPTLYGCSLFFAFVTPTSYFFSHYQNSFYGMIPVPAIGYHLFFTFSLVHLVYAIGLLWNRFKTSSDPKVQQMIRYVLIGFVFNGALTFTNALPVFGVAFYPLGNFGFIPIGLMAYGILQHQLLDTTKSWFSQIVFSKILKFFIWSPFLLAFLFWLLAPGSVFHQDFFYQHFLIYSFPPLLTVIVCYAMTSFCFTKGVIKMEHLLFGAICWLWGGLAVEMLLTGNLQSSTIALKVSRINHFFLVNQTAFSLHFIYRIVNRPFRKLIYFNYLFGFFLMFWTHTHYYFQNEMYRYICGFFPQGNWFFLVFCVNAGLVMAWAIRLLFQNWKEGQDPDKKKQIYYIFIGIVITGFLNLGNALPALGMEIYPLGNYSFLAVLVMAYGIFRHDVLYLNPYTKKRIYAQLVKIVIITGYSLLIPISFWVLKAYSWQHILNRFVPYGIPPFTSFLACLFVSTVLLRLGQRQKEAWIFNLICMLYAILNLDIMLNGIITDPELGLRLNRWDHCFLGFLFGLSMHLFFLITKHQSQRWLIPFAYGFALVMAPFTQTSYYFQGMYTYSWGFFAKKAFLFDIASTLWVCGSIYCSILMYFYYRKASQVYEKHRLLYLGIGYLMTCMLNLGGIPAVHGYDFYPPGNFSFIPILLFAYGLLIHNQTELLQIIRSFFNGFGVIGFLILTALILSTIKVFNEPPLGIFLGGTIMLVSVHVFYRSWNAILNLFFVQEKVALQQTFNFIMELLSQASRHRELYQFVSYSLFRTLFSSRCTLLLQSAPEQSFSGWTYQSLQPHFFSNADPIKDSEHPAFISKDSTFLNWIGQEKQGVYQEKVEEWMIMHPSLTQAESELIITEWIQPIFYEEQLIGLLLLGAKTNSSAYTKVEQAFLYQLTMALGPYIQNINLIQSLESKVQERTHALSEALEDSKLKEQEILHINQLVQAVNTTLDLDAVIRQLMVLLQDIIDFNQIGILLIDEQKQELYLSKYYGRDVSEETIKRVEKIRMSLHDENSWCIKTVLNNEPCYVSPITPELVEFFEEHDRELHQITLCQSYVFYPLEIQNKVIGEVIFGNSKKPFILTDPEILKIQRYMIQIATAINNARLVKETKHAYDAVLEKQTQLEIAHQEVARVNEEIKQVNASLEHKVAEQTQELRDALDKLKEADRMKDEFLANTSHELRTPLNGIIGLGESLIDGAAGAITSGQAANLQMIVQSGKRLANLVNDILDFSKMKHHELQLQIKAVDIKSITDLVLTLASHLTAQKQLQLLNQIPDNLPLIEADENRLQQILLNLVGNAVKFTHEGKITLSAEQRTNSILISIADTGIGISKAQQERIFQLFEQADGSTSRIYGGTGLGLAVTKQLVELHGSTIHVESEEGKGSTFSFELPVCQDQRALNSPTHTSHKEPHENDNFNTAWDLNTGQKNQAQGAFKEGENLSFFESKESSGNGTILVVDDEMINVQVLKNQLQLHGYNVLSTYNGFQALEVLSEQQPDLVLLDIMMPRMNGYEVCQKIREQHSGIALPIIMLTAKNQVLDLVEGFRSGANDYLIKPFHKDELLSRVQMHLKLKEAAHSLRDAERQKLELQTAQTVQQLFLPKADPELAEIDIASFYQSASETGGDWYDYHYYRDIQRLDVLIGDVTGHGVPSALITAMCGSVYHSLEEHYHKLVVDELRSQFIHPSYFLELLSNLIYTTTNKAYAMTFFYSALDLKNKMLVYSSAGHNPCYIWRREKFNIFRNERSSQRAIYEAAVPSSPLGYYHNTQYKYKTLSLQKDDVILWYTDGLIENYNEKGRPVGSKRLKAVLSDSEDLTAAQIRDRIVEMVKDFCGKQPSEDDITLVVGRIR
ncbi:SpoIIE family protein phosphatase [Deltaproteobacteria bacterium TL4]